MDGPAEASRLPTAPSAAPEPRRQVLEVFEHAPEESLGHGGIAIPVRMAEVVAARRRGATQGRERPAVKPERVAHVIQSERMADLAEDQSDDVTPGAIAARLRIDTGFPGDLRHQMVGNEIAELAQYAQLRRRWSGVLLILHNLPGGRKQGLTSTLFHPAMGRKTKLTVPHCVWNSRNREFHRGVRLIFK